MSIAAERSTLENLRPSCNVLGIDLGTTNNVVAIWMVSKPSPEVITIDKNDRSIPSFVWFKEDGTFDVGKNAVRNLKQFPQDVCYDAKRMIGQLFTNITALQSEYWSFKVVNNDGRPAYELSNGKKVEPEEISTHVLKRAKSMAENYVCGVLHYAVITVPAYFNITQKQATRRAAENAGLIVLSIEAEPSAVAFACNYDHKRYDDYSLFVFDLGGGTFDITIMTIKDGRFCIVASGGDNNLGGRDFDNILMKELIKRLKKLGAQNLDSVKSKIRLRALAEATKIALTTCDKELVNCNDFIVGNEKDGTFEITRAEFENLSKHLRSALKDACLKTLAEAKMEAEDFNSVLLIGGSSRMPMITQLLAGIFPHSLEQQFYQCRGLNPDEFVAYGAAIRAAQLCDPSHRDYTAVTFSNLLPVGIGIALDDDQYSLMFRSGTKFPTKMKKRYFTTKNNQKFYSFDVYEGERVQASQNKKILSLTIPDLPPGLAGDVYIDATFSLDPNGLLTVTARSPTSSAEKTVNYRHVIIARKPIEQLFTELAINAESDQQKKIVMEARIELRSNIQNVKNRYISENIIPYNKRQFLMGNCDKVIDWLNMNPDETLTEEIINLAKQIERDNKELIDMRQMIIEEKLVKIKEQRTIYPIVELKFPYDRALNPVGMDVGTTRCCVAVNRSEGIELIAIDNESRLMPSYIAYDEKMPKCGSIVCKRIKNYFKSTVFDIKRIIGKSFNSIVVDPNWPFDIFEENEKVIIKIMGNGNKEKSLLPEEITSSLIQHMKQEVEKFQGDIPVSEAVITIPVTFNEAQIDSTIVAAILAGLEKVKILPEPIAACLTYASKQQIPENATVLLFDLGGGTLDVCIICVKNQNLHILGSYGDQYLGGRDFDLILMNHFIAVLKDRYKIDLISGSDKAKILKKYKLMLLCQEIKHDLQSLESSWLNVSDIDSTLEDEITITREEFENLSNALLIRIKSIVFQAFGGTNLNLNDISYVLHAGGGCRMLMIKNLLKSIFSNAQQLFTVNPDWAVAYGATLYSYFLKTANFDQLDHLQDPTQYDESHQELAI